MPPVQTTVSFIVAWTVVTIVPASTAFHVNPQSLTRGSIVKLNKLKEPNNHNNGDCQNNNNDFSRRRRMAVIDGSFFNDTDTAAGRKSMYRDALKRRRLMSICSLLALASVVNRDSVDAIDSKHTEQREGIDVRFFISGGLSAAISHGITTPIDVVKTKMQATPEVYSGGLPSAVATIFREEGGGPKVFIKGLGPTVIGYGMEGALKFGIYESLKPVMISILVWNDPPTIPYLMASVVAGAVASIVLCPIESTRIKLVTYPGFANGLVDGILRLVKEDGLFSTFTGFYAMIAKQVPYTMAKQVADDLFAASMYSAATGYYHLDIAHQSDTKFEISILAAALASVLACIASHPGDVMLTETYKQRTSSEEGFIEIATHIWQTRGIRGFFAGIGARFLHVGAIITFQLVIYDYTKQYLGLAATGSTT